MCLNLTPARGVSSGTLKIKRDYCKDIPGNGSNDIIPGVF
jgi:hypothetical protein